MKIDLKSFLDGYAGLSFILLFPGFFFYHTLLGLGIITPVLGGYFGVVSLVLLPALLIVFFIIHGVRSSQYCFFDVIFCLILLTIFFVSVVNYTINLPEDYAREMFLWSMSGFVFMITCYLLARTIPFDSRLFKNTLFFSVILMSLIVVNNIGIHGIFYLRADSINSQFVATYQGFARSLVVVSLVILSFIKKKQEIIFFLILSVVLFFNGARTEFSLFVISFIIMNLYFSFCSINKIIYVISTLSIIILFTSIAFVYSHDVLQFLPNNRMLELSHILSSTSYQARYEMFVDGLKVISDSPLLGNYGSYTHLGGVGYYPHNLMSVWVNLGLFGFSLYVLAFALISAILFVSIGKNYKDFIEFKVFILFSVFTILALILSKDYSYMLVGFMFGFSSRFLLSRNTALAKRMSF